MSEEYPEPPSKSLKLYKRGRYWRESGWIYREGNVVTGDVWDAYADGYLEAAKKMIEKAETHELERNTFGYPIFFLFSHYLELRMKEIIKNGQELINKPQYFPKSHNLIHLWGLCKDLFKTLDGWTTYEDLDDKTRNTYETLDYFIAELGLDPHAQSFRYPVDRHNQPLLAEGRLESLNVHNLSIVAEWMSFIFEGISVGIDEEINAKRESMKRFREESR